MGMAGTGLSSLLDASSIYANPALMGNPFGPRPSGILRQLTFPGLSFGFSDNGLDLLEDAREAAQDPEGMGAFLSRFGKGEGFHLGEELLSGILVHRFFLGVHQSMVLDVQGYPLARARPSRFPEGAMTEVTAEALVYGRAGLYVLGGFSLPAGDRASFGVMARYGLRTTVSGVSELGAGTEDAEGERLADTVEVGHGFNVDLGLVYEFWRAGGGRVSVVGRNVGMGSYQSVDEEKPYAKADPFDLDIGLALAPSFRRVSVAPVFSVEFHEIMRQDLLLEDTVRIGAELGLAKPFEQSPLSLRVGHDLMDFSYGTTIDLFLFRLELASSHRRVYLPNGKTRGQRMYLLRTSWDYHAP